MRGLPFVKDSGFFGGGILGFCRVPRKGGVEPCRAIVAVQLKWTLVAAAMLTFAFNQPSVRGRSIMIDRQSHGAEPQMSSDDLYLEEVFTDRRVGTIQRLSPVDSLGRPDPERPVLYIGQTQILTAAGALPLSFEIEAGNLREATAKFAEGAKAALQQTMERLEEMRREAASSIIVPDAGGAAAQLGGLGGMAGGGKIRMP